MNKIILISALCLLACTKEKVVTKTNTETKVVDNTKLLNPNNWKRVKTYNDANQLYQIDYWSGQTKDSFWTYNVSTGKLIYRVDIEGYLSSYEKLTTYWVDNNEIAYLEYWRDNEGRIIRTKYTQPNGTIQDNKTTYINEK